MTMLRTFGLRFTTALLAIAGLVTVPSHGQAAGDGLVWQFNEYRDSETNRMVANLTFGVPETDAIKVRGGCEARSGTAIQSATMTFAADIGTLKNGAEVDVQFSGGGFSRLVKGTVTGVGNTEERITGINLQLGYKDPLWTAMRTRTGLDYTVRGYRSNALDLTGAMKPVNDLLQTCRGYAEALEPEEPENGSDSGSSSGGEKISESEAFRIARDLGTVDAWQAFLKSFPTGFRADLARAYVKSLGKGGTGGEASQQAPGEPAEPTLSTIDLGPGTSRWEVRRRKLGVVGNGRVYSAGVRAKGIEFIAYCVDKRNQDEGGYGLAGVVRQYQQGIYPRFETRVRQGLAAAQPASGGTLREIEMTFSGGHRSEGATANRQFDNGELTIGRYGSAFDLRLADVQSMLADQTMTIELAPFAATFQLNGSRNAICNVLNQCGARAPGCRGRTTSPRKPSNVTQCTGGRYYSRSRGACRCPSSQPHFYGGKCRTVRDCPGDSDLVNGRCIKVDDDPPPRKASCSGGQYYSNGRKRCVCPKSRPRWNGSKCKKAITAIKCNRGRVYSANRGACVCPSSEPNFYGGRCRANRDCPGDSELVKGQCVKIRTPYVIKPAKPKKPTVKETIEQLGNNCSVLKAGCKLGSKSMCRKFQSQC